MGEGTLAEVLAGSATWCVIEGDNEAALAGLPDRSFDVCLQDPPYEAEAHTKYRRVKTSGTAGAGRWGGHDDRQALKAPIDFPAITEAQRRESGARVAELTKRWALTFCQAEAAQKWRAAFEAGGHQYIRTGIWTKPDAQPQLTGDRPGHGYESICITHPPGRKRWNGGGKCAVFDHVRDQGKAPHPTTKPATLMLELVSLFTEPGEVVLDPFCGGGSTGVACLRLGRRFVGIEINPVFAAVARERLRAEANGLSLRDARAGQLPMFGSTT